MDRIGGDVVVRNFLTEIGRPGRMAAAYDDYIADREDATWVNTGFPRYVGKTVIMEAARAFVAVRLDAIDVELVGIGTTPSGLVLTERRDTAKDPDGNELHVIPVMGAFEVVDGKILHWRDFFDPGPVHALIEEQLAAGGAAIAPELL